MLYQIIKQLQNTSSTKEKEEILIKNKRNQDLKEFLRLTYCPSVVCDIGEKTYPIRNNEGVANFKDFESLERVVENLATRRFTGNKALNYLSEMQDLFSDEFAELLRYAILKDARIGVGPKVINKVWKNLIVDVPYQRCSLMDDKVIERVNSSKEGVVVQLKADGVFAVHTPDGMFTRNGSKFPDEFADLFYTNTNYCIEGEIVWRHRISGLPVSRKQGNGITNSVLKSGYDIYDDDYSKYYPEFQVWNIIPEHDWKNHSCNIPYIDRYKLLCEVVSEAPNSDLIVIDTYFCKTMSDIIKINNDYLSEGYEGTIIKFPEGVWKYNTSKDMIKVKVAVDVDMRIESIEEATGKNAGMVGRINVVSEDGLVRCGVNATGTEKERIEFLKANPIGKIIQCTCNDILDSNSKEGYSLFLGRAKASVSDLRFDKNEADTFERILEIFASVGVVKNYETNKG